jgi:16S rRNA (guanine1516-N2)-methyltransferase
MSGLLKLYYSPDCEEQAQAYANWCDLIAADEFPKVSALCLSADGLGLLSSEYSKPFYVVHKREAYRTELLKACGSGQTILDACAGFGADGLVLAQQGWQVTMVERERIVWLLLQSVFAGFTGVQTLCADGIDHLGSTTQDWDVIYLDPMFPSRNKRALPHRGLQHLRQLAAPFDHDLGTCIRLAQRRALHRVVLKRRATDPIVLPPNFQVRGSTIRFDVYTGLVSDRTA